MIDVVGMRSIVEIFHLCLPVMFTPQSADIQLEKLVDPFPSSRQGVKVPEPRACARPHFVLPR